jgi:hypothetical protein
MHDDVSGGERLENAGPDGNDGPDSTNGNTGSPSQREPQTARPRRPLVTVQLVPGQSAGGPLVNLSGQVIGIDLAGTAHGTSITSYAIPINEALAVARQLRH